MDCTFKFFSFWQKIKIKSPIKNEIMNKLIGLNDYQIAPEFADHYVFEGERAKAARAPIKANPCPVLNPYFGWLDANWDIITKFKIKSVQWIREPVLQIGPVKKNLKRKINTWLEENETQLTKMLDREMKQSVSLEPAISKIWNDLQKPMIIHRKQPMAWMKFSCNSIVGKIVLTPDAISCFTSVEAKMSMMTDTANLLQPAKLPPFKQYNTETTPHYFYI